MKKIILGSIVLTMFSISIIIFQVSCQKSVSAQQKTNQQNLILYDGEDSFPAGTLVTTDSLGHTTSTPQYRYERKFYISNIDGSNQRNIPVNLPNGFYATGNACLTSDGTTLVFNVAQYNNGIFREIYSCSIDGSNLKRVVPVDHTLLGVY